MTVYQSPFRAVLLGFLIGSIVSLTFQRFFFSHQKTTSSRYEGYDYGDLSQKEYMEILRGAFQMPSLWLIGASKCATSSIANALDHHPLIGNIKKESSERLHTSTTESHVFDGESFDVIKALHKLTKGVQMVDNSKQRAWNSLNKTLAMEYTPHYLFEPLVPERICLAYKLLYGSCSSELQVAARFVIMIREPVARTVSSWEYKRIKGGERESFENIVVDGENQSTAMLKCWRRHKASATINVEQALRACPTWRLLTPSPHRFHERISRSHVGKGMYFYQLAHWWTILPRENFLVVQCEKYYTDPATYFTKILTFAGVEALGRTGFKDTNDLTTAASVHLNSMHRENLRSEVTPPLKERLSMLFQPHNQRLDKLLGVTTGYYDNSILDAKKMKKKKEEKEGQEEGEEDTALET